MERFIDVFGLKKSKKLPDDELYVMLMLQRSEGSDAGVDCDDPVVALACSLDTDECPAACKEGSKEEDTDTVVKSGDLDVTSAGNSNGRVFIGRASELDTVTLKTSEEVTVSRITLEREGYSTKDNIVEVWLEDENGTKIAEAKGLDSKGQVKLTLKKDYKAIDGELVATIVVKAAATADEAAGYKALKAGATVGFKVVDVESTAKNVNISGKANTYTAIEFDGSSVYFTANPTTKDYNFEAGELYEVAKFKVVAPEDSTIILRGFTFANANDNNNIDLRKYFDNAEVTIAGEKVSGLDASVNKSDELVVNFKDVELKAKQKAEVIVKISLADDFDQFNNKVEFKVKDFVAVDGKVESRVAVDEAKGALPTLTAYTFKGGKIKLTNVKLGNIDAAQNSEGIVIAEGNITVNESVKGTFYIDVTGRAAGAIKELTFSVNNEETDGSKYDLTKAPKGSSLDSAKIVAGDIAKNDAGDNYYVAKINAADGTDLTNTAEWKEVTIADATVEDTDFARFYFNNVEIDKSGKIKFMIDTVDANTWEKESANFSIFKSDSFTSLVYDESNKPAKGEVSGSITLSKVTIQPAKASMTNSLTKEVEFSNRDSNRKVVFDGTYTAKKGDIELNKFSIEQTTTSTANLSNNKITFYLSIDGSEVADIKYGTTELATVSDTFNNIKVKAGDSVKVKLEAEVEADNADGYIDSTTNSLGKYELSISGEDVNGNSNSGVGSAKTVTMKLVEKGSVNIAAGATKETVLYKTADAEIAAFNVKPANGASETDLEEISFALVKDNTTTPAKVLNSVDDVTVKINKIEADDCSLNTSDVTVGGVTYPVGAIVTCTMNEKVGSEGVNVVVSLDEETTGVVILKNLEINDKAQTRTFKKRFEGALVKVNSLKDLKGTTEFTLGVDKDSELTVRNLTFTFTNGVAAVSLNKVFDEGDTIEAVGVQDKVGLLDSIEYYVSAAGDYINAAGTKCTTEDEDFYGVKAADNTMVAYTSGEKYCKVSISKDNYTDFFKVGDQYARVYASNSN